jgi:hypothetical protein
MPIYAGTAQQAREAFDQGAAPGIFVRPRRLNLMMKGLRA